MPPRSPAFWSQPHSRLAALLTPLSCLYQAGYRLRRRLTTPAPLTAKLLCIGNLIAGGAGKTPVALAIGDYCREQGIHACFLSKGYGGSITTPTQVNPAAHSAAEVGDEPLLLARCLPTIIGHDRAAAARFAEAQGFALIIMDDGFQNPNLRPDMALVVVDAGFGFGNGHSLPAGPLREPVESGLARADAVVLVERGQAPAPLPPLALPLLRAALHTHCPSPLTGQKIIAFSGIARPQQFFDSLRRDSGATVIDCRSFADHHPFTAAELQALQADAQQHKASLVTTAKDAVRLPADFAAQVIVAEAALKWHNAAELHAVLAPLLSWKEAADAAT